MNIVIAEDDLQVAELVSTALEAEHHDLRIATKDHQIQRHINESECDLVILDLAMQGASGMDLLRTVRDTNPYLLVLALARSAETDDGIKSLDSGADDYLAKPFTYFEIAAHVRALLRRRNSQAVPILRSFDLEMDRMRRIVNRGGRTIELTPKEFALLEYLLLHAGHDVSRASIIRNVWKLTTDTQTNVVDVYINYLRRKIDADVSKRLIHTVRGWGYRIEGQLQASAAR